MIIKGTLIFMSVNSSSKSEGVYPFLLTDEGQSIRIALIGDNPFENSKLKDYESMMVILEGELNENGKFIAERIEKVMSENK